MLDTDVEELTGMNGAGPVVISNLLGAVAQPVRQAKSSTLTYNGDWMVQAAGLNGFITEFEYRS